MTKETASIVCICFVFGFYALGIGLDLLGYRKLKAVCFGLGLVANLVGAYFVFTI